MGKGGGKANNVAQPPQGPYIFIIFSLSGPYSLEALSDSLIIDPLREGNTKEARRSDVQGNPQVVCDNDRYTCFTYPRTAYPWLGHVK